MRADSSKHPKALLASEAIAVRIKPKQWQLDELQAGIAELDSGEEVSHEKVKKWLKSWGKPRESGAPSLIR